MLVMDGSWAERGSRVERAQGGNEEGKGEGVKANEQTLVIWPSVATASKRFWLNEAPPIALVASTSSVSGIEAPAPWACGVWRQRGGVVRTVCFTKIKWWWRGLGRERAKRVGCDVQVDELVADGRRERAESEVAVSL